MKRFLVLLFGYSLLALPAAAQIPPAGALNIGVTSVVGGPPVVSDCLTVGTGNKLAQATCGGAPSGAAGGDLGGTYPNPTVVGGSHITNASIANSGLANPATTVNGQTCTLGSTCTIAVGSGTVTTVSVATANGVSGVVANPTTTPAITLTLGAITPSSVNGNTITTGTGTLTLGAGKIATISNTLTFTGTDASSVAFGAGGTVLYAPIALASLATQATNTVAGNATSGSASPTALAVGSCSTASSALIWTTNTGFGCNTSINAATLGGATFSAPGAIGGGTAGAGSFTTLTASTSISAVPTFTFTTAVGGTAGQNPKLALYSSGNTVFGIGVASGIMTYQVANGSVHSWYINDNNSPGNAAMTLGGSGAFSVPGLPNTATTSALCYNIGTGAITYDGTLGTCTVSTIRAKNLVAPLSDKEGFDLVMAQKSWRYELKKGLPTYQPGEEIGFVAEEAYKHDSRLVAVNPDGSIAGFRYEQYTAALTSAFKYLKAENDDLRACQEAWACRLFGRN